METENPDHKNKEKEKSLPEEEPIGWEEAMGGKNNFAIWKIIAIGVIAVLMALKLLL